MMVVSTCTALIQSTDKGGDEMIDYLRRLWHDEEGLTTVEYALLLVLIVVVAITAWQTLGTNVKTKVETVGNTLGA